MVYVAYMQIFFCRSPAEIWIFMLSVVDWIVCLFSRSCHAMLCMSAAYAVMRCLSVCLSVCLSRSWVLSKRINVSSKFFHHRVAKPFSFFHTKWHGNILTATPPNGGSECRCGRQKSRFWVYIWLHCVLSRLRPARCYQHGAAGPRSRKLWYLSLVVSGGVCW